MLHACVCNCVSVYVQLYMCYKFATCCYCSCMRHASCVYVCISVLYDFALLLLNLTTWCLILYFIIHIIKYEFIWIRVYMFITEFMSENKLFYILKNQTVNRWTSGSTGKNLNREPHRFFKLWLEVFRRSLNLNKRGYVKQCVTYIVYEIVRLVVGKYGICPAVVFVSGLQVVISTT